MLRPIARHVLWPLHEMAMRRPTFRSYRELLQSQYWSQESLRALQLEKLRQLVSIAINETAGYAEIAGCDRRWLPEALEDLRHLPFLSKAVLTSRREDLTNRAVPGGPQRSSTGGSTGDPLIFYVDRRRQAFDKAARMRAHQWFGVLPGDREAYIWGSPIELSAQDRLKHVRDALLNDRLWSAFELSAESVGRLVAGLRRFRPDCVFGYPSSLAILCELAEEQNLSLRDVGVKAVFCTAEVLYPHQREAIGRGFGGARVADGYGSREGGFVAHECPAGKYHITSESVIVEIVNDGHVMGPGESGEIVVTNLDNHAMPFLRYRTGDIGTSSDEVCACGRTLELLEVVQGRSEDFLVTPDGRWLSGPALSYLFRDIPGVAKYQIVQDEVQRLCVKVVPGPGFPPDGEHQMVARAQMFVGGSVAVAIERVAEIPRESSGKFRCILSKVAQSRRSAATQREEPPPTRISPS